MLHGLSNEQGLRAFSMFNMKIAPSSFLNFRTTESIINHLNKFKRLKYLHVTIFTRMCLLANPIITCESYSTFVSTLEKHIYTHSLPLDAPVSKLIPQKITISKLVYLTIWRDDNNKHI